MRKFNLLKYAENEMEASAMNKIRGGASCTPETCKSNDINAQTTNGMAVLRKNNPVELKPITTAPDTLVKDSIP